MCNCADLVIVIGDAAADLSDRKVATSAEDNRQETQQAILQELLSTLKEEANRLDDDVWMYEHPRCTYR